MADDQACIVGLRESNGQIVSVLDQIHHPAGHRDAHGSIGIACYKLDEGRGDHRRHRLRHIEPQDSLGLHLRGFSDLVCFVDLGENLQTAFVIGLPNFCEADLACISVEKPHAEASFQLTDRLAESGCGQPKMISRAGEAGPLDDSGECFQLREFRSPHYTALPKEPNQFIAY